jgi:hypothetical protein
VARSCGGRFTQRLEGSRFGLYAAALANLVPPPIPLDRAKTGGSRERLRGLQFYGWVRKDRSERRIIALRRSREPPAFTRSSGITLGTKFARAAAYDPKRLPSRRWEQTRLVNVPRFSRTTTRTRTNGIAFRLPKFFSFGKTPALQYSWKTTVNTSSTPTASARPSAGLFSVYFFYFWWGSNSF